MPMEIGTTFVFRNGERLVRKGHDGIFWSDGNNLYVTYVVIQLSKSVKLYTCDVCILLYINYTLKSI